jgi:hypothetical protein
MKGWDEEYRDQVINIASNPDLQVAKQDFESCLQEGQGWRVEVVREERQIVVGRFRSSPSLNR